MLIWRPVDQGGTLVASIPKSYEAVVLEALRQYHSSEVIMCSRGVDEAGILTDDYASLHDLSEEKSPRILLKWMVQQLIEMGFTGEAESDEG